jgi:hypothetical protein
LVIFLIEEKIKKIEIKAYVKNNTNIEKSIFLKQIARYLKVGSIDNNVRLSAYSKYSKYCL